VLDLEFYGPINKEDTKISQTDRTILLVIAKQNPEFWPRLLAQAGKPAPNIKARGSAPDHCLRQCLEPFPTCSDSCASWQAQGPVIDGGACWRRPAAVWALSGPALAGSPVRLQDCNLDKVCDCRWTGTSGWMRMTRRRRRISACRRALTSPAYRTSRTLATWAPWEVRRAEPWWGYLQGGLCCCAPLVCRPDGVAVRVVLACCERFE
jgi:hypothetical protein